MGRLNLSNNRIPVPDSEVMRTGGFIHDPGGDLRPLRQLRECVPFQGHGWLLSDVEWAQVAAGLMDKTELAPAEDHLVVLWVGFGTPRITFTWSRPWAGRTAPGRRCGTTSTGSGRPARRLRCDLGFGPLPQPSALRRGARPAASRSAAAGARRRQRVGCCVQQPSWTCSSAPFPTSRSALTALCVMAAAKTQLAVNLCVLAWL